MPKHQRYKHIAVASTFSPRFEAVLAEAKRVRDRFGSTLSLIYAGEQNHESTRKFREALTALDLPADSTVHYRSGDPAEAILQVITTQNVDLVLAGALEKELVLHPFLGNVARRLVREAASSVFLFTKPEPEPKPMRRIVFLLTDCPDAQSAFAQTLELARAEGCERLYVVRVVTTFDDARAAGDGAAPPSDQEHEHALERFVLEAGETSVPIEVRALRGNTGFAAADFVQSVNADLLVVPLGSSVAGEFPANLAWLTDVIPCNLWLIR